MKGILEFHIAADDKIDQHQKLIKLAADSKENEIVDPSTKEILGKWVTCSGGNGDRDWVRMITRADPRNPDKVQLPIYKDEFYVSGELLETACATHDDLGQPAIGFQFTDKGRTDFGRLTTKYGKAKNLPDHTQLAIILDDEIRTAPSINEPITAGTGIITGVPAKEVGPIVSVLEAGSCQYS